MKKSKKMLILAIPFFLVLSMVLALSVSATESTVKISFQTNQSQTPDGFVGDGGDQYGDRGNGFTYGWNRNNIGNARDYGLMEKDPRLASLNQFGEGFLWEIAVPNGKYEVTVGLGDIQYPHEVKGKLLLLVEDVVIFENEQVDGRWRHVKPVEEIYTANTVEVEVADGKLTLDPKDSANKNIKINYIEIKSLSAAPFPSTNPETPTTPGSGADQPGGPSSPSVPGGSDIKLIVNEEEVQADVQPVLLNGRVMVPVRVIAETIGADVFWNAERNAVLINSLPGQARQKEANIQLIVNGLEVKPDVPPFLLQGRTLLPVRWVSEALGLNVTWDQQNRTVNVELEPLAEPSMELFGWASVNAEDVNGTTGGGDATPQTVTTREELATLAGDDVPRVLVVSGTIASGVEPISIGSNKTIVGEDKYATILGGITIDNQSNVIVRNLNFQGYWPIFGPADTIAARYSHHLWFDQLNIWNASDGLLDLTQGTNYVTVSWSKFFYTDSSHPHRLASLNGGGADHEETDTDRNKVTYHHNWFANKVNQRMPRLLFGQGHVYNNYYTTADNGYAIGVGVFASMLVENNYFENTNNPHQFMYPDRRPAYITATGNIYDNTRGRTDTGAATPDGYEPVEPFTNPPYAYELDEAKDIPLLVKRFAGPK